MVSALAVSLAAAGDRIGISASAICSGIIGREDEIRRIGLSPATLILQEAMCGLVARGRAADVAPSRNRRFKGRNTRRPCRASSEKSGLCRRGGCRETLSSPPAPEAGCGGHKAVTEA